MTTTITLAADLAADPYLLARLTSVCARRCFRLERLHYDDGRVELTVTGPEAHAERLGHWLDRQVHCMKL